MTLQYSTSFAAGRAGGAIIIGLVAIVDGSVHWNHCFPPSPFKHCQLMATQAWSILNRLWKLHFLRAFLSFVVLLLQLLLVVYQRWIFWASFFYKFQIMVQRYLEWCTFFGLSILVTIQLMDGITCDICELSIKCVESTQIVKESEPVHHTHRFLKKLWREKKWQISPLLLTIIVFHRSAVTYMNRQESFEKQKFDWKQ